MLAIPRLRLSRTPKFVAAFMMISLLTVHVLSDPCNSIAKADRLISKTHLSVQAVTDYSLSREPPIVSGRQAHMFDTP